MLNNNFLDIFEVLKITENGKAKHEEKLHEECNMVLEQLMTQILSSAEKGDSFVKFDLEDKTETTEIARIVTKHIDNNTLFDARLYHNDDKDHTITITVTWYSHVVKSKMEDKERKEKIKTLSTKLNDVSFKTIIPRLLIKGSNQKYYLRSFKQTPNMAVYVKKGYSFQLFEEKYHLTANALDESKNHMVTQEGKTDWIADSDVKNLRMFKEL